MERKQNGKKRISEKSGGCIIRENSGSLWKSGGESKHYGFNKEKCRLFSVKEAGKLHTGFGKTFRGNKLFVLGYAWGHLERER